MKKAERLFFSALVLNWFSPILFAETPADVRRINLKRREAVQILVQMRKIEQDTIQEDEELKGLQERFRERLKIRLAEKPEYQKLKKDLETIKRELYGRPGLPDKSLPPEPDRGEKTRTE